MDKPRSDKTRRKCHDQRAWRTLDFKQCGAKQRERGVLNEVPVCADAAPKKQIAPVSKTDATKPHPTQRDLKPKRNDHCSEDRGGYAG